MIKLYNQILLFATLVCLLMLYHFTDYRNYASTCFWGAGLIIMIDYIIFIINFSDKIKKSNPVLYNKYSFGFMLTRNAFTDDYFLNRIDQEDRESIQKLKSVFIYFGICFILFFASSLLIVLT